MKAQNLKQGQLTFRQLQKLSKHFSRGALFFLDEGLPQSNIYSAEFRSIAQQKMQLDGKTKSLIERVEQHRLNSLAIDEALD